MLIFGLSILRPGLYRIRFMANLWVQCPVAQMASTLQTPVYPHPQPSFATHENTSSMNDSFGQSALHSFDSSRSVALTPSATPPPRATPQHNMSFNVNSGSAMNGVVLKGGSFGQYGDVNGHPQSSASYYGQDAEPQIYTVSGIQCLHSCASHSCHIGCLF